ncbi:hypothetical protein D1007_37659 [Hordeum vulgare]|nr:hypothetical protein D1007_37659 [Hordeum vulgare]
MATGCKDKGPIGEGVAMVNVPVTEMDGAADFLRSGAKNKGVVGAGDRAQSSASGAGVENLMAHLRLTTAESTAVIIDDVDDLEMVDPNQAFVGKVMSSNVLHIETIKSAMRPAWGNPRGLNFNSVGDNLFVVEFGSQADRDRVMEGSPWRVGKHAVLLKFFDADISPVDVVFDRLAIWARITKLPTRLMRAARGIEIAKPIGNVMRVETDDLGHCWGLYMRIRVEVDVQKPLLCYVTVILSRLQSSATYEVKYERLPLYCFSCGLLGHSALGCANPADRDENGDLPYSAKRLSVDDGMKTSGGSHSGSFASRGTSHVPGSRGSAGSSARGGRDGGRGARKGQRDAGSVFFPEGRDWKRPGPGISGSGKRDGGLQCSTNYQSDEEYNGS